MHKIQEVFCPRWARLNWRLRVGGGSVMMIVLTLGAISSLRAKEYLSEEEARTYPGFFFQGEYAGEIRPQIGAEPIPVGLQVAVYGEKEFRALFYHGGLPGAGADGDAFELEFTDADAVLVEFGVEGTPQFRYSGNGFTALGPTGESLGRLERVRRVSSTMGLTAPDAAVVLFDGSHLEHWRSGSAMTDEGWLQEGATTAQEYGDYRLHLEVKLPFMPESRDQRRANSGIYIQNRYEVQILDSFALAPAFNGNTSLYRFRAPSINVTYPPLTWQTYDVFFRAPRFAANGEKTDHAGVTVYLNGVLVQEDVELKAGTGRGASLPEVARGELVLQNHSDPVRFRNVWLVEEDYAPPAEPILASPFPD